MTDENLEQAPRPGYWAVIPAGVRYDDRIPASSKVLYAEISALCDQHGYCWAGNDYFARLYQMTERSIRRQLAALEEYGYIRIEETRGDHNAVLDRKIYAGINPLFEAGLPLDKNVQRAEPLDKNVRPLDKKVQRDIINNKQETITRVRDRSENGPEWKPERFAKFWTFYRKIPGEGGRARNEKKQDAIRAWDRLRPDDELISTIGRALLRQLSTPEWSRGVGIPMAATYLNNRRWEDAEDLPEPGTAAASTPYDGGRRDLTWI